MASLAGVTFILAIVIGLGLGIGLLRHPERRSERETVLWLTIIVILVAAAVFVSYSVDHGLMAARFAIPDPSGPNVDAVHTFFE